MLDKNIINCEPKYIENIVIKTCRLIEQEMELPQHEIIFKNNLNANGYYNVLGAMYCKEKILYINSKLLDLELFSYKELITTTIHEYLHSYCYDNYKKYRESNSSLIYKDHGLLFNYYLAKSKILLNDKIFPMMSLPNAIKNKRFKDWLVEFKNATF